MGKQAKNDNFRHVDDATYSGVTSTPLGLKKTDAGFPTGDEGILGLTVRWGGTFNTSSAAGSPVADGALKFLRSLRVSTDKHGDIIKGVSGLSMSRVLRLGRHNCTPVVVDCASNADATTFRAQLTIPFADEDRMQRPYDAVIDMKNALMKVHRAYGVVTDVQSAGTAATLNSIREDISVEVLPGIETVTEPEGTPDRRVSELPSYIPVWEENDVEAGTSGIAKCPISTGDRIIRRIYISQQTIDATTGRQTEVSSVIADTAKVSFLIGNETVVDRVTWGELQDKNVRDAEVASMPTGWAFLDFDKSNSIRKMLDLYKYPSGLTCNVVIDSITGVSTAKLKVVQEYFQLIPPQAIREV